jgi:hypothetical protein
MPKDKNIFGGGNPLSLYTPMTEIEQEVLDRLRESEDLEVIVKGWGEIESPKIRFGDLRLSIPINITFNAPTVHVPVYYFDLILKMRGEEGPILFQKREDAVYDGKPLMVGAGTNLQMTWDIAIQQIDPKFVKMIVPGARGLTTREGNRKLDSSKKNILNNLRKEEEKIRNYSKNKVIESSIKESQDTSIKKIL